MEKVAARSSPLSSMRSISGPPERARSIPRARAWASPGGVSKASRSGPGHRGVAHQVGRHHRGAGRHPFQEDDPEALPMQGRGAQHIGPPDPAHLLALADEAQPLDPGVFRARLLQNIGVGTVGRHPQPDVGTEGAHGFQQHGQALSRLVAADEHDRRPLRRPGIRRLVGRHLDPVPYHLVGPADLVAGRSHGFLRHRYPQVEVVGGPDAQPPERPDPAAGSSPVKRPDQGVTPEGQGGQGWPRRERLVEVDHIESLVAEGSDGPHGSGGVGGDGGHRAVRCGREGVPERRHRRIRGRPVAGAEDPRVHSELAQGPAQAENLPLHATRNGEAVWAHESDPHLQEATRTTARPRTSRRSTLDPW